jgi:glucokinase
LTHKESSPEEVSALLEQGDPDAEQALHQTCHCLAIGIGAAINFLDPEVVIVTGGLSVLGDALLDPLRREIMTCVFPEKLVEIQIQIGQLGAYAGAIGAALFLRDQKSPAGPAAGHAG